MGKLLLNGQDKSHWQHWMPARTERERERVRASLTHACGMEVVEPLCGTDSLADVDLHVYCREMKTVVQEPGHKCSQKRIFSLHWNQPSNPEWLNDYPNRSTSLSWLFHTTRRNKRCSSTEWENLSLKDDTSCDVIYVIVNDSILGTKTWCVVPSSSAADEGWKNTNG